jgi:hypothetical protein
MAAKEGCRLSPRHKSGPPTRLRCSNQKRLFTHRLRSNKKLSPSRSQPKRSNQSISNNSPNPNNQRNSSPNPSQKIIRNSRPRNKPVTSSPQHSLITNLATPPITLQVIKPGRYFLMVTSRQRHQPERTYMIKNLIFSGLTALTFVPGQAQTVTTTTTAVSSANHAVNIAKDGVDQGLRDHIVSVYGVGTPAAIQTWWVIFYDPSVASHGRVVKLDNDQITRTYEAKGGVVYPDSLTFARSQVTDAEPALAAAQNYAAQHALAYDNVRALLRTTAKDQPLRWRVQLLDKSANKGFVFVNASDGTFAMYAPPGSIPSKGGTGTGGVVGDARHAANDVKDTFLGIGGDLQEFFTGERTVDQ